jgi:hypothetical protein
VVKTELVHRAVPKARGLGNQRIGRNSRSKIVKGKSFLKKSLQTARLVIPLASPLNHVLPPPSWPPFNLLRIPHLDLLVLDGEEDNDGEAPDDDALEDEEDGAEDPVEAGNAWAGVEAAFATGSALQALERVIQVVDAFLALQSKKKQVGAPPVPSAVLRGSIEF